MKLKRHLELHL